MEDGPFSSALFRMRLIQEQCAQKKGKRKSAGSVVRERGAVSVGPVITAIAASVALAMWCRELEKSRGIRTHCAVP